MPTGTIKFFNQDRGYGFIQAEDGSPDVFVHIKAAQQAGITSVQEGMRVGYEVAIDPRRGKSQAANLRLL